MSVTKKYKYGNTGRSVENYITPMLATAIDAPFSDKDWVFELKLDGFRAIAETGKKSLKFYSRNGLSFVDRFPTISDALMKIKKQMILDGEVVLFNEQGVPDFQKLQHYEENKHFPLLYYVFDLIELDGINLCQKPLLERKRLLKTALPKNSKIILYSDHVAEEGIALFKETVKKQLEGLIAKRIHSFYFPGVRSKDWLKIKGVQSQEAIIVGYTEPRGSRKHFGSILLGQYAKGKLKYIGHAGTGFTEKTLAEVMSKMKPLKTLTSPFNERIKTNAPVTWLLPKLVCEVNYTQETRDGMLRHPVFKALRPEKRSKDIKKETEMPIKAKKIVK